VELLKTNHFFHARTRFKSAPALKAATFSPSSQISPEVGRSRQPIRFTRVLLPEPEGPIIATIRREQIRKGDAVQGADQATVVLFGFADNSGDVFEFDH